MFKPVLISATLLIILLSCQTAIIINQHEGILELEANIKDRIAMEKVGQLEAQLVLKNLSNDTMFVPLLLKNGEPFFLIWSLNKGNTPIYRSNAPDMTTYGQGLNNEHVQQVNANSSQKLVFHIFINEGFLRERGEIKKGAYSLKFFVENFYHSAKNKTFPMWFGRVESNEVVIELY